MAKKTVKTISRFIGGIADFDREGIPDSYAFGQSIDVRTNPQNVSILPRTIKESATVIQALPKWGEYLPTTTDTLIYDEGGNIYKRTTAGVTTLLHTVPNSHGNGMSYFGEDDYVYYASDKLVGRYGNISGSNPQFVDDFFGSQGGVPLNTNSLSLVAASSQYANRADTASLSITGNLSVECQIKPTTLPSVAGDQMTLISKWTESGNARSYKFGITPISNYFGDGSDGPLTISVNTTDSPIDSACSGTAGAFTLTATNVSFAAGQQIFIHQTQGTNSGSWQKNKIVSYTAGTITLETALNATYSSSGTSKAQVLVLKQYTTVTVNSGKVWTAKAWDGTTGGILGFLANVSFTNNGTVTASGSNGARAQGQGTYASAVTTGGGFRGSSGRASTTYPYYGSRGEGNLNGGWNNNDYTASSYDSGGGGAKWSRDGSFRGGTGPSGGGGGSNASVGGTGSRPPYAYLNIAGAGAITITGAADLTTIEFGGGGSGGVDDGNYFSGTDEVVASGGSGGGIIFVGALDIQNASGTITTNGGVGGTRQNEALEYAGGGGGAGGSILFKCQTATLGSNSSATGGLGGKSLTQTEVGSNGISGTGGDGGDGRVHIDYLTSYTGSSTPTITALQDNSLGSSNGVALLLAISKDGTVSETYQKPANIQTGVWQDVSASWNQATLTTEFFLNAVSLGTVPGTLNLINDNASTFNVGMDRDSSGNPQHFYNGLIDEVRVFAGVLNGDDYLYGLKQQVNPATLGMQGYYQFNAVATDATANANNLTLVNSPTYSTDVPFSSPTTRIDIDIDSPTTGNTYTTPTAISESSADKKTFTPTKDPQKSIRLYIAAIGTGDWTVTVHDQYNNTVASKTVANASLYTGNFEFVFTDIWRPLTNFTNNYHFHITSTVADGTVRTGSASDLSTVDYTTYYQYLVTDTNFHPVAKFLQFLVIGNERYVAKIEAAVYYPNYITLPSGYNVRYFGYWNEYLAIGTTKGSDITSQDVGRIYFWDGISSSSSIKNSRVAYG